MSDQRPLYPVDPWRIRELTFDPAYASRNETIFSLANGHLGLRGNLEEEAGNIGHGPYAKNHQVLLNVADGKRIQLHVGDDPFDLATGSVQAYERSLDLRTGVLTRSVRWRSPRGAVVDVVARRIVSLTRPDVAAIDFAVTLAEGEATLRVVSAINARTRNQDVSDDPRVGAHLPDGALRTAHHEASGTWGAVVQRTRTTRLAVVAAAEHELRGDAIAGAAAGPSSVAGENGVAMTVEIDGHAGTQALRGQWRRFKVA